MSNGQGGDRQRIVFHGGLLDGIEGPAGRIVTDMFDYVERHGTVVRVHRYKIDPHRGDDGLLNAHFLATFGGAEFEADRMEQVE